MSIGSRGMLGEAAKRNPMTVDKIKQEAIEGWLHRPEGAPRAALAVTHGAGGNAESPLLVAIAETWASAGYLVLRYNLPYRQRRPKGPPSGSAKADQAGIVTVIKYLRELAGLRERDVPLYIAGQSYGGRMSSMVAAGEEKHLCDGLILFSYPLHPPGNAAKLRTEHFPAIKMPAFFVHGTRDPFGSPEEMEAARKLLGGPSELYIVEGAGHGVPPASIPAALEAFEKFGKSKPVAARKK